LSNFVFQKLKLLASPWLNKNDWEISFRKKQKHAILSGTFATKVVEEFFIKTQLCGFHGPIYELDHSSL